MLIIVSELGTLVARIVSAVTGCLMFQEKIRVLASHLADKKVRAEAGFNKEKQKA